MSDKLFRDLAVSAGLPAANDYLAQDGATKNTRKRLVTTVPYQVATRAALIALDATGAGDGQIAFVQGNTASRDGGGGFYVYDSASTATANGTTVLQPTTGPGRWLSVSIAAATFLAGLGTAAFQNIGAFAQVANNLSDLTDKAAAKLNLNIRTLNLRDYGAVGDGTTDDNAAIAAWLAAATSYSVLYVPAGKYRFTVGNFSLPASLTGVTICGDGWGSELFNDTGASGLNTLNIPRTCSRVNIHDLAFTGNASVRANGIHIRMNSSFSRIQGCYFQGCSDFAVHITYDSTGWSTNNAFVGNLVVGTLGDGVHVGQSSDCLIAGNWFYQTGDDAIAAVADSTSYVPTRITVVGNHVYDAGGAGSSGAGVRFAEVIEGLIASNHIMQTKEAGIALARYTSTTAYNNRVTVVGNQIWYANSLGGSGGIMAHFTFDCDILSNSIDELAGGNGISVLDAQDLLISGCTFRDVPMAVYIEQTTTNVATSWDGVTLCDNVVKYASNAGASAFNLSPAAGITINQLMFDNNKARALAGGFLYYDRINQGRITNNTRFGSAITAGGTVSGVTSANNN